MLDTDDYLYELFDDTEMEGYTLDRLVGMVKYKFGDYEVHPRDEEDIEYTESPEEDDDEEEDDLWGEDDKEEDDWWGDDDWWDSIWDDDDECADTCYDWSCDAWLDYWEDDWGKPC